MTKCELSLNDLHIKLLAKIIVFILFLGACADSEQQTKRYELDKKGFERIGYYGPLIFAYEELPISMVIGIPDSIKNPKLFDAITNRLQYAINRFKMGIIDSVAFNKELEKWKSVYLDHEINIPEHFTRSDIFYVIGEGSKGQKVIGVDANLDYDFSDAVFWNKHPADTNFQKIHPSVPTIEIKGEFWSDSTLISEKKNLRIGINELPNLDYYSIPSEVYAPTFSAKINKNKHHFYVDNQGAWSLKTQFTQIVRYDPESRKTLGTYNMGDSVMIDNMVLAFTDIDVAGNWIEVNTFGKDESFVFPGIGGMAPEIVAETLEGDKFVLSDFKGKFVLLDFWGTWCAPCVESIPDLKLSFSGFGEQIQFVGIASDESEKVVKFVEKHEVKWMQIVAEGKQRQIIEDYRVLGFPKYMLINPDGRITHIDGNLHPSKLNQTLADILK